VNERELQRTFGQLRAPAEADAQERAWRVVQAAYAERVPAPRRHLRLRPALVLAALAALGALALTAPGQAVLDSVREAIGVERARPALFSLPSRGALLVADPIGGAWIVHDDGSKRRLGAFREASWSPFGRFAVAAGATELAALEPDGSVRWTLSRPGIRFPRWGGSKSDTRIAYLSGKDLRVVAGDGTGDRLLVRGVDRVPPAWRPGGRFVVAFARRGRVQALDVATGAVLWTRAAEQARDLNWSRDGRLLLVRGERSLEVLDRSGHRRFDLVAGDEAAPVTAAALSPAGKAVAFVQRAGDQSSLWLVPKLQPDGSAARRLFSGRGSFTGLAWSPDGRWLLVPWRDADQWLFFRATGVHAIRGVADIARQFGGFPALGGWCCANGS
jgi:outer membrane protein assembly factor BamB